MEALKSATAAVEQTVSKHLRLKGNPAQASAVSFSYHPAAILPRAAPHLEARAWLTPQLAQMLSHRTADVASMPIIFGMARPTKLSGDRTWPCHLEQLILISGVKVQSVHFKSQPIKTKSGIGSSITGLEHGGGRCNILPYFLLSHTFQRSCH